MIGDDVCAEPDPGSLPRYSSTKSGPRPFQRLIMDPLPRKLLAITILCALWAAVVLVAFVPVEKDAVVGSYRLHSSWFLQKEARPARIDLDKDGELRVYAENGEVTLRAKWWWDAAEGFLRSDAHELDRRIRGYHGWTGTTLYWRLAPSFDYGEELEMQRLDR